MNYGHLENIKENSTFYQFMEIEHDSHYEKVRFFENNKKRIGNLDFDFRTFVWCDYALSIFEIGRYQEFIKLSDELIPLVISENIYEIRGIAIYEAMLFRKAASLYNIQKFEEAEYVFGELCKIDKDPINKKAWKQAKYKILKNKIRYVDAISILFFIITASIIALELLVVGNFYPHYLEMVEYSRIATFSLGVSCIIGSELYIRIKSNRIYKSFISKKK